MKETRNFEVKINEIGSRIDLFLTFKNNDLTRSFIKSLIIKGNIEINSIRGVHSAYKVKAGDIIKLFIEDLEPTQVKAENIDLNVIYEDQNYIVINKPYGMVVHPANGNWSGTLANAILYHYQSLPSLNGEQYRPGIVHRLDKDTSGVILVAKNNEYMWWLTRQFAERKIQKTYECLVLGNFVPHQVLKYKNKELKLSLEGEYLKVESGLERSKLNRKVVLANNDGKYSTTFIKPLSVKIFKFRNKEYSFTHCIVKPKTGRTHQIRAHLKALGYPIWGDPLYMSHKQLNIVEEICNNSGISNRLFLHAKEIAFKDKKGEEKHYEAALPEELEKILRK